MKAFWRRHYLGVELGASCAGAVGFALWAELWGGYGLLEPLLLSRGNGLFATLASIDGALLGFVIATWAIVLTVADTDRFEVVRKSRHYPYLWRTLSSTARWLAVAAASAMAVLLIGTKGVAGADGVLACAGSTLVAGWRVARCIWVLERVTNIAGGGPRGSET